MAQLVKNPTAMRETWVQSLGQEDPLEKGMATHSSIRAWRIPWTEEPGRLQSKGSQRVRHDWATWLSLLLLWKSIRTSWKFKVNRNLCPPGRRVQVYFLGTRKSRISRCKKTRPRGGWNSNCKGGRISESQYSAYYSRLLLYKVLERKALRL